MATNPTPRARRHRATAWTLLAALIGIALASPAAANASALRITRGELSVVAPRPGSGVRATALLATGAEIVLEVVSDRSGHVTVVREPGRNPAAKPAAQPASSPTACSDNAHNLTPYWQHSKYKWWFNSGSTPTNISVSSAETQITRGIDNIVNAHNDCGMADNVNAKHKYKGRTTHGVQIDVNSGCTSPDGDNEVGFGDLAAGNVGLTCVWFKGDKIKEADVRFDKHDYAFAVSASSCSGAYILQAVATHEFGHVYGLNHVSESSHANLTMSTAVATCDASPQTLGRGDVLGLQVHY